MLRTTIRAFIVRLLETQSTCAPPTYCRNGGKTASERVALIIVMPIIATNNATVL